MFGWVNVEFPDGFIHSELLSRMVIIICFGLGNFRFGQVYGKIFNFLSRSAEL